MTDLHHAALTATGIHFEDTIMTANQTTVRTKAERFAALAADIASPSDREWMLMKASTVSHPCGYVGRWYEFEDGSRLTIHSGVMVVS